MRLSVQEIIIPACTEVKDKDKDVMMFECREDKDVIYLRYAKKEDANQQKTED